MELYTDMFIKMVISLVLMLFVIRVIGRKELAQATPLDILFVMMLAELIGGVVHSPDLNWKLLIFVIVAWTGLTWIITKLTQNKKMETLIFGSPKIIIRNGVIDEKLMVKENLTRQEILTQLRQQDVFKLSEVKLGVLEINGNITVKKKENT